MTDRLVPLLASCVAILSPSTVPQDRVPHVAATLISSHFVLPEGVRPCEVPRLAGHIARVAGVPAGVEHIPGPCEALPQRPGGRSLQGLTLGEALDILVSSDPRYSWRVVDGIISFRPTAAAGFHQHFLHTSIGSLSLVDANMGDAFAGVLKILGINYPTPSDPPTPQGNLRLTLALGSVSALKALNAIVRQHGAMWWEVRYCKPELSRQYATVSLWTFDKTGLSFRLDQSFRSKGAGDPCGPNSRD
jgi:hypothetical protein